jgi:hypothetical protein
MYLIKLRFESNIKGVYTYEEETAKDLYWKNKKVIRMLIRWCNNLDISIGYTEKNIEGLDFYSCGFIIGDLCRLIDNVVYDLNKNIKEEEQKRKFILEVIETTEILDTSTRR